MLLANMVQPNLTQFSAPIWWPLLLAATEYFRLETAQGRDDLLIFNNFNQPSHKQPNVIKLPHENRIGTEGGGLELGMLSPPNPPAT